MSDLLTDGAVEAAELDYAAHRDVADALAAFIAYHEGERPCERCAGTGAQYVDDDYAMGYKTPPCSDCNGTGKVREDRLVKLSGVVAALRAMKMPDSPWSDPGPLAADFVEREFGGDHE